MQEKKIIQKNLFVINEEINPKKKPNEISDFLTNEELKKESEKRPRERNNTNKLIDKNNNHLNYEKNIDFIKEKSYSYKTIEKQKLTPVLKHYVSLKEEHKERLLLYRLGDNYECFFEDAVYNSTS